MDIGEQTAVTYISLKIDWIYITETKFIYCAVRAEYFNIQFKPFFRLSGLCHG
jgi:hypothetical protein